MWRRRWQSWEWPTMGRARSTQRSEYGGPAGQACLQSTRARLTWIPLDWARLDFSRRSLCKMRCLGFNQIQLVWPAAECARLASTMCVQVELACLSHKTGLPGLPKEVLAYVQAQWTYLGSRRLGFQQNGIVWETSVWARPGCSRMRPPGICCDDKAPSSADRAYACMHGTTLYTFQLCCRLGLSVVCAAAGA